MLTIKIVATFLLSPLQHFSSLLFKSISSSPCSRRWTQLGRGRLNVLVTILKFLRPKKIRLSFTFFLTFA
jgi:hypothetical protein